MASSTSTSVAPYWGNLKPPVNSSGLQDSIGQPEADTTVVNERVQDTASKPRRTLNRESVQSQATTTSSVASTFRQDGLAPRPTSLPYGGDSYSKDYLDRRRRRASRDAETNFDDNRAPPPPAPDAPRTITSSSYKQPYGNEEISEEHQAPVRSKSARKPVGPVRAPPEDLYRDERRAARAARAEAERGMLRVDTASRRERNPLLESPLAAGDDTVDGFNRGGSINARKERHEILGVRSQGQSRKVSASEVEAQRRREWAPDRSPLQKLELTLDSITKEEKRARLEKAENVAREARTDQGGKTSGKVRARPAEFDEPEPQTVPEAGIARNISNKQKPDLQRRVPPDKERPIDVDPNSPNQLGRGFEYQPQRQTSTSSRANEKAAVPPQRGPSFRERAAIPLAGAVAGAATGAAIGRSGSNKLRKAPPGDPWYIRRQEAERNAQQIDLPSPSADNRRDVRVVDGASLEKPQPFLSKNPPSEDPRSKHSNRRVEDYPSDDLSGEDEYAAPVSRTTSKKIAQLAGADITSGSSNRPVPAVQPQVSHVNRAQGYDQNRGQNPEQGNTLTAIQATNGNHNIPPDRLAVPHGHDGHHHFSDVIPAHHRRSHYQPGDGIYAPSVRLKEWQTAGVATLTGDLLDLDRVQTEAEKDQAWWEAGHTGKRRPSTRRGNIEMFDGGNEVGNGTVTFDSSVSSNEEGDNLPVLVKFHRWARNCDVVVPRARQYIGFEGTSASKGKVKRRNSSWRMKPTGSSGQRLDAEHTMSRLLLPDALNTECCSSNQFHLSTRHIFHPFHMCSSKTLDSLLTPSMRYIRIRSSVDRTLFKPALFLKCGPLLRYTGIRKEKVQSRSRRPDAVKERSVWRGSVMIVTTDSNSSYDTVPTLRLFAQPRALLPPPPSQLDGEAVVAPEYVDPIAGLPKIGRDGRTLYVRPVEELEEEKDLSVDETENGLFENSRTTTAGQPIGGLDGMDGEKKGKSAEVKGFRLHAERGLTFWRFNIEVELRDQQQRIAYRINRGPATGFWVPGRSQTMNIMFHSCNGFSLSVNPDQFSGPDPMWRDVLNTHQTQPFHVMIGGGDQIYNDVIMKKAPLFQDWLAIKNPLHKHNAPFTPQMQEEMDSFYLERYAMWFSQGLFGLANSQIPMVNIFDDHDIIDGFGSYPDHFMDSPVFSGLGAIAFKYYMLFQHQSSIDEGEETEPSWLLGNHPGPYIKELSRSVYMSMGKGVALLGLDCRTERSRDEVLSEETTRKFLKRCDEEIVKGETKHLIVLLGIPIAYPRLVWLENILTSRLMDPVKALGRTGLFGGFLNKFDGGVEILDDLDDHWTAKNHKAERNDFVLDLQELAASKSVRVTILGGDVHLAAIGQFFSNPKLGIPKHRDFRYMPNIISSAIVNTPPPEMMADILNKRNKVHHLDHDTDENMIPIFTHDVTGMKRNNKCLLPRRNWCSIRPYDPELTPPPTPVSERSPSPPRRGLLRRLSSSRGPSYRPDAGVPQSRPPISGAFRNLSISRGRSSSDYQRPEPRRSFSLSRAGKFLGFGKRKTDEDDSNEYGYESDGQYPQEEQVHVPRMRGGAGDPEDLAFYPPQTTAPRRTRISRNDAVREDRYQPYYEDPPEPVPVPAPVQRRAQPRAQPHVPAPAVQPQSQSRAQAPAQLQPQTQLQAQRQTATATDPSQLPAAIPPAIRPKPFHRTPTGLSEKQRRKAGDSYDVNLEGGLDICLNVEVSQKDPAGITVPYRLLVPALWYDEEDERGREGVGERKGSAMKRLMSFGRRKKEEAWSDSEGEEEMEGR